jgi:hypothetical protein
MKVGLIGLCFGLLLYAAAAEAKIRPHYTTQTLQRMHSADAGAAAPVAPTGHSADSVPGCDDSTGTQLQLISYNSGPLITSPNVIPVFWTSAVDPSLKQSSVTGGIARSYYNMVTGPFLDYLKQFDVSGYTLQYGSAVAEYTISPQGFYPITQASDNDIRQELEWQIQHGFLPPNSSNNFYAVYFPPGWIIDGLAGEESCNDPCASSPFGCSAFCAYHEEDTSNNALGAVRYGVFPDLTAGSCPVGCGNQGTWGNETMAASHELAEAITDPDTLHGWTTGYDEIGDPCVPACDRNGCHPCTQGVSGIYDSTMNNYYVVQKLWSNANGGLCFDATQMNSCSGTVGGSISCTRVATSGQSNITGSDPSMVYAMIPLSGTAPSDVTLDMSRAFTSTTYQPNKICALGVPGGACLQFAGSAPQEGSAVLAFPPPAGSPDAKKCIRASMCPSGYQPESNHPPNVPLCCQSLSTFLADTGQLYAIAPAVLSPTTTVPVPTLPPWGSVLLLVVLGCSPIAIARMRRERTAS